MRSILNFQWTLILMFSVMVMSCGNRQPETVSISPFENNDEVKALLSNIAGIPQLFTITSRRDTFLTGERGTVLHIDPKYLKTASGSSVEGEIAVELLELTDKASLVMHNAETMSDGKLLITGAAYFINMTALGKSLKIENEKAVQVVFPKLTDEEMLLFLGKPDSTGIISWKATNQNFKSPGIEIYKGEITDTIKMTDQQYRDYLKEQKVQKQVERYESIALKDFGWINCDRFQIDPGPKVDIPLFISDDSITYARFYAVFKDMNSVMITDYYNGKDWCKFSNIPENKEIELLGITSKGSQTYVFHQTINTSTVKRLDVDFKATTEDEIKGLIEKLN